MREMITQSYANNKVEGQPITLEPPAIGRLDEIKVPTLVIVGDYDVTGTQTSMRSSPKA